MKFFNSVLDQANREIAFRQRHLSAPVHSKLVQRVRGPSYAEMSFHESDFQEFRTLWLPNKIRSFGVVRPDPEIETIDARHQKGKLDA